jgi:hypothetical protein
VLERSAPQQLGPIREALSQLQLAYVRIGGAPPGADAGPPPARTESESPAAGTARPQAGEGAPEPPPEPPKPGEAGPAQRSGRLWIPGQ